MNTFFIRAFADPRIAAAVQTKSVAEKLHEPMLNPMKTFMVRVELRNNASPADYSNLHQRMEAQFFYRKIQGTDGIWYDLPPAEYQCIANGTIESIRARVAQIAYGVDSSVRVLVTEGLSAWVGLDRSSYQGPTLQPPVAILDYLRSSSAFPPPDYRPTNGVPFRL